MIDRVETTGQTWLALTLNCCRCHDHKFDPITQREFYRFYAFFNNVPESGMVGTDGKNTDPVIQIPDAKMEVELARIEGEIKVAEEHVAAAQKQIPALAAGWEKGFSRDVEEDSGGVERSQSEGSKKRRQRDADAQADGSWLASGANPAHDTYVITAPLEKGEFSGLLIEVFPDASLPNQSLGRYPNGNFVLTGVEVDISAPTLPAPVEVDFTKAETDYEQKNYEVKFIVENKPKKGKGANDKKGWAVDGNDVTKRLPRKAMFLAGAAVAVPDQATITIRLKHEGIWATQYRAVSAVNVVAAAGVGEAEWGKGAGVVACGAGCRGGSADCGAARGD